MNPVPILITISDPWDFGEAVAWRPVLGELLQTQTGDHGGRALIKFDQQISYRGKVYRYAVASPRHVDRYITEIESGKSVDCALTGISDEQAESNNAMDTSRWRGGLAFIADVKPVS